MTVNYTSNKKEKSKETKVTEASHLPIESLRILIYRMESTVSVLPMVQILLVPQSKGNNYVKIGTDSEKPCEVLFFTRDPPLQWTLLTALREEHPCLEFVLRHPPCCGMSSTHVKPPRLVETVPNHPSFSGCPPLSKQCCFSSCSSRALRPSLC